MNWLRKTLIFTMLLPLLLLSTTLNSSKALAASQLEKVDLTTHYYVSDAIQYKNKTFMIGGEWADSIDQVQLQVVVKEGDITNTVIPASEFSGNPSSENNRPYLLKETDNKIYIGVDKEGQLSAIFIVDKETNQYEKKSLDELYAPIKQMIDENGYNSSDFTFSIEGTFFKDNNVLWAVARKSDSYDYEKNERIPGVTLLVNKTNGVIKTYVDKKYDYQRSDGTTDFNFWSFLSFFGIDQQGNFYGADIKQKSLTKVDTKGNETTYFLPNGISYLFGDLIINNDTVYADYKYDDKDTFYSGVFMIKDGQLELVNSSYQVHDKRLDVDGKLWYTSWNNGISNWAVGYLDNSLNYTPVYASEGGKYFDVYNGKVVFYSTQGYGFPVSLPEPEQTGTTDETGTTDTTDTPSIPSAPPAQEAPKKTGWVENNGTWSFYNESGVKVTGWLQTGGKWYYLDTNGAMKTGWQQAGNKWYYLDGSGAMKTGWLKSGVKWYYLDGSGAMKTGWLKSGRDWYYLDGTGIMKTGWLSSGGTWYYLNTSGTLATGWKKLSNKWYYFYSGGSMASNTTIAGCKLGKDGAWIQ